MDFYSSKEITLILSPSFRKMDSSNISSEIDKYMSVGSSSSSLFGSTGFERRASHSSIGSNMDEVGEFEVQFLHEVAPPRRSRRVEHQQVDFARNAAIVDHVFSEIIGHAIFYPSNVGLQLF